MNVTNIKYDGRSLDNNRNIDVFIIILDLRIDSNPIFTLWTSHFCNVYTNHEMSTTLHQEWFN